MTTVEMEKPVVTKKLADRFEQMKNDFDYPSEVCGFENYNGGIPEHENLCFDDFEYLLARMYVLGYEIEKPKLFYIKLTSKSKLDVEKGRAFRYLNLGKHSGKYFLSDKSEDVNIQVKFTQAEAETFIKSEPKGMWVTEEIE